MLVGSLSTTGKSGHTQPGQISQQPAASGQSLEPAGIFERSKKSKGPGQPGKPKGPKNSKRSKKSKNTGQSAATDSRSTEPITEGDLKADADRSKRMKLDPLRTWDARKASSLLAPVMVQVLAVWCKLAGPSAAALSPDFRSLPKLSQMTKYLSQCVDRFMERNLLSEESRQIIATTASNDAPVPEIVNMPFDQVTSAVAAMFKSEVATLERKNLAEYYFLDVIRKVVEGNRGNTKHYYSKQLLHAVTGGNEKEQTVRGRGYSWVLLEAMRQGGAMMPITYRVPAMNRILQSDKSDRLIEDDIKSWTPTMIKMAMHLEAFIDLTRDPALSRSVAWASPYDQTRWNKAQRQTPEFLDLVAGADLLRLGYRGEVNCAWVVMHSAEGPFVIKDVNVDAFLGELSGTYDME